MNAVTTPVATSLLRQLSGFRGYPKAGAGEDYFIAALCEVSVSVDHAIAIVKCFDQDFPTLKEIRDTAISLRPKYEPQVDQRKEWERIYGPPRPFEVPREISETFRMSLPISQEREIDRLWRDVMAYLRPRGENPKRDIQFTPIGRCWQIAQALGYSMNGAQIEEIKRYEYANPRSRENLPTKPVPRQPITQADIDRVKAGEQEDRWE